MANIIIIMSPSFSLSCSLLVFLPSHVQSLSLLDLPWAFIVKCWPGISLLPSSSSSWNGLASLVLDVKSRIIGNTYVMQQLWKMVCSSFMSSERSPHLGLKLLPLRERTGVSKLLATNLGAARPRGPEIRPSPRIPSPVDSFFQSS